MTGLKSYNKTPWPHLYTAVHANRKPVCLLLVVFYSIKLTYVYIIANTIKKQTADVHCQYSTRYFNLWFCRVNLIVHLLNCLVLAVRDCAGIAVNKSFATDRHSITEQSSWTLGTVELLTTWCLQLSWCKSEIYAMHVTLTDQKSSSLLFFCLWRVVWLCEYYTWTSTNHLYSSSEKYFSLPSSHSYTVPHTSNYSN